MNIYVDMDGVLCDSLDCWEKWTLKNFNTGNGSCSYWSDLRDRLGPDVLRYWDEGSNVYRESIPFLFAIDFMEELLTDHNVKVVTSTFQNMVYEKLHWFKTYMPFMKENHIICIPSNAHKSPHTKNGILIDDGFQNIVDHVSHNNCYGILYNQDDKYEHVSMFKNNCDGKRIRYCISYNQVLLELEKMEKGE